MLETPAEKRYTMCDFAIDILTAVAAVTAVLLIASSMGAL